MSPVGRRLDTDLVARGLMSSRHRAQQAITAGRVRVDGRVVLKASMRVPSDADLVVTPAPEGREYASRGAHKLAGALDRAARDGLRVEGRDALDAGASHGGFTDVLLRRGAARVLAVDIGERQLTSHLAADPRVTVMDRTNIRTLTAPAVPWRPQLVVADLSFISLTQAIGPLAGTALPDADLLLMVKPQFEVGRHRVGGGVVTDPALHRDAIACVLQAARDHGLGPHLVAPSAMVGARGNQEFFVWLSRAPTTPSTSQDMVRDAVAEAAARRPAAP